MNERIKQLALEAGGGLSCIAEPLEHPLKFSESELEKFAELIVKDCVSTLTDMHMWQSVNNQNYPSAWHDAVDQGIDTIKNHFGVE